VIPIQRGTVDGLYFEISGEGEPLLFLHAGGMDARMWVAEVHSFAAEFRVIRFDARGVGRSEIPIRPYSPTDDVATLLRHLGVERVSLVGCSLGARTAIDFAIEHPAAVESVVVIGAGVSGFAFSGGYQQRVVTILGQLAQGDVQRFVDAWLADSAFGPRNVESRELVGRMLHDNHRLFTGDAAFMQPLEPPALDRLGELRAPLLALVGAADDSDIHEIARIIEERAADARVVTVPDAGHMINLDAPATFHRLASAFLREARRAAE
jgi:3-oxoadipate enol-lactonase